MLEDFRNRRQHQFRRGLGSFAHGLHGGNHIRRGDFPNGDRPEPRQNQLVDMAPPLTGRAFRQAGKDLLHVIRRQLAEALRRRGLDFGELLFPRHVRTLLNLGAGLDSHSSCFGKGQFGIAPQGQFPPLAAEPVSQNPCRRALGG